MLSVQASRGATGTLASMLKKRTFDYRLPRLSLMTNMHVPCQQPSPGERLAGCYMPVQ